MSPPWRASLLFGLLVVVHLGWGLLRVPTKVIGRRVDDVRQFHADGAANFLLTTAHLQGAAAIQWVSDHVPADAVVLFRGDSAGALEFAPLLLAPRLLVAESACPPGQSEYAGRKVARAVLDGQEGVVVLVGHRELRRDSGVVPSDITVVVR